jgi:glycosyltransferase involved in cell wall biosynthesis
MRVLAFLNDLAAYRDRFVMLQRTAERVGHIHLLTDRLPADFDVPPSPALTLTAVSGLRIRRPLFTPLLWQTARPLARVDLVHDHAGFLWPLFAELRLRPGRPALLSSSFASTYDWYRVLRKGPRSNWKLRERRYWQALVNEQAMVRLADAFTVFGEGHRAPLAETYGVPVERVRSLPNCVDPAVFRPQPPDPALHGFGPEAQVLLFVGSVFRYKGYYDLVQAFARVHERHPRARLLFVGAAPPGEAEAVAAEPARHGVADKVRLAGAVPRSKLPALMAASAAFVLPSYAEGSPRVMIEAMACGLPVVGSRIPGIQALDPDERFAYFADRGDVGQLAAALDRLLSSPGEARARGEAGRARFESHHTPEAAADVLAALYRQLTRRS